MKFNHLFLIDPLESLHPRLDSSLRFMFALHERGHDIFVAEVSDLFIESCLADSRLNHLRNVVCQKLEWEKDSCFSSPKFLAQKKTTKQLSQFHAVHMRKDPPFNLDYISATWLLDLIGNKTKVYNSPEALRSCNEKLLITEFPEWTAPLLATTSISKMIDFIRKHHDVVLKPLHLYGGRGVIRVKSQEYNDSELSKLLEAEIYSSTALPKEQTPPALRLLQPFNPQITHGEIRVFSAFGQPIAWCLKKPKEGEFLANTRAGAQLLEFKPSFAVKDLVTTIAQKLRHRGIELIGFDIIGEKVSEINITSPRLLLPPEVEIDPSYREFALLCEQDLN